MQLKRRLISKLLAWKENTHKKPLILQGARQVGKTTLLKEFGTQHYSDLAVFNFEEDPALAGFFTDKLSPLKILENLSIYRGQTIHPEKTLIFFDEIQACPSALSSLKYFCEQAPQYHIVSAGSLLGIQLSEARSFPVGKVNFLHLYPFCFYEFLDACQKELLRKMLEEKADLTSIPPPFHEELLTLLKTYFFIGGMPEAVASYASQIKAGQVPDFQNIRTIQEEILKTYLLDFSKHAETHEVLRITQIWNSIPHHLARENKKFIFSAVQKSARAREYEHALQWLKDAGLTHSIHCTETPHIPLKSYEDPDIFKVYLLDVGLLGAMMRLEAQTLILGNELFTHTKGSLVENFVAQELIFHLGNLPNYWASQGSAEVDFLISTLIHNKEAIIPIEVKSGTSTKAKSLNEYDKRYHPPLIIRSNMSNVSTKDHFLNLPLYLLGSLQNVIAHIRVEKIPG